MLSAGSASGTASALACTSGKSTPNSLISRRACSSCLDEVLHDHARLTAAGLTIFAASVDPPEQAAGLQEHVGDGMTIVCSFPVDVLEAIGARDRRGAPWYDRLLFRAPRGEIAMPTALVVDVSGRIVYAYRASRVDDRARPGDILAALAR